MGYIQDFAGKSATWLTRDPAEGHNKIVTIFRLIFSVAFFGLVGLTMSLVSLAQIVGISRPRSLVDSWGFLFVGILIALVGYLSFIVLFSLLLKRRWSAERRFLMQSRASQLLITGFTLAFLAGAAVMSVEFWHLSVLARILGTTVWVSISFYWVKLYILVMRELRRPFRDVMTEAAAAEEREKQEKQKAAARAEEREKAGKKIIPWWQIVVFECLSIIAVLSAVYLMVRSLSQLLGIASPSAAEEYYLFTADPWIYFFLSILGLGSGSL